MAEVVAAGAAGGTGVAGDAGFEGDAVTGLEAGCCGDGAVGGDDAGGFVAEEDGSVDDVAA